MASVAATLSLDWWRMCPPLLLKERESEFNTKQAVVQLPTEE